MKEHPILFSGPMVRAILEGRKTMTRRVINERLRKDGCKLVPELLQQIGVGAACPYGQPGDRLWVRETFVETPDGSPIYRADPMFDGCDRGDIAWNWKPSIFMPRRVSRILLEITATRVERLQDISEEDAKAEGAEAKRCGELRQCPLSLLGGKGSILPAAPRYRYGFYELWDSINAGRGFGWDANPWVWVIEFAQIKEAPDA